MVRFLQSEGWNVAGTYLANDRNTLPKFRDVRFYQCDLRNGRRVARLLTTLQPSHIFHFGAQSVATVSRMEPVRTFESNIMGSLNLFESVRHMKRRPIVVSACSSAEYGNVPASATPVKEEQPLKPLHPYGVSKVCLDLLAREYFLDYGIPAINVRLFNTTGPGKTNDAPSDFIRQLVRIKKRLQRPIVEVGNLKPRRAFLDVQDAVRGFYIAALRGKAGEAYNLCAARTFRIGEVLRLAVNLSALKVKIQHVPRLMRPSDEKIIFGDTSKIRKQTGWRPLKSFGQTLLSMLDYWCAAL